MSLELTLLRFLKDRDKYERMYKALPKKALDQRTQILLDDYGKWFREFSAAPHIDFATFWLWFRGFAHPTLTDEQAAVYEVLLKEAQVDLPDSIESGLRERLVAASTAYHMASLLTKWQDGEEVDLYTSMRSLVEDFEVQAKRSVKLPWVNPDIDELLKQDANDTGVHFRLECLNRAMRPLRSGDFGIVAGRPDKGKTTFMASELTFMAQQVAALYPGRPIAWMNNEGPGERIYTRLYQAALNATIPELVTLSQAATIRAKYAGAVGGDKDIIRVFNIHDFWNTEVEDIIRAVNPCIILFDMVDNIRFGGDIANGGQRTDQVLETMYQWSRILAVKHDAIVMATSQISADGDGLPYPTLSMLKDSKTGKQGAADFIITLGASNDQMLQSSRFMGTTKNKLVRSGGPKDPRCEVIFDGDRARIYIP